MHPSLQTRWRQAIQREGIRLIVFVVWFLYMTLFFRLFVPYTAAAAHLAAARFMSPAGLGYAAMAVAVLAVGLHVHVVLCRLLLLKVRVFGAKEYA